ncbi:TonB-linked SusC/RagA family outer membrane protein [Mariniflexile fucanivorans]|uniref:TonB-linked SusC/RagA family outer membrane protein n=1 Tax=Mariniflexile fucanivorans TaxID=264023 RepID=A0A4R1RQM0_9FLAO|nr:SusC/RagA family TonB-linked outer membrane protein [Mariniflexile fucanivorans]TCL68604.1 TonB-linked SusC/RagA family outer membrane protein [Mariniflexile fucanivorans]
MKKKLTGLLMLFMALSIQLSYAQDKKITGKITDADGIPLSSATVIVEGTNRGVVSDFDGNYSITAAENSVLKISFIGMKTQLVPVGSKTTVNVVLAEDLEGLDTVVVTGYQKIDRKLFTGSASTLNASDIRLEGVADISRGLQGQVAGVEIENASGTFGTAPVIRIRGNASINGANKPLWVIDGVVLEDAVELSNQDITTGNLETILSSSTAGIGPDDVETFTVLKDASATAQYGARALNGVIVITTKRGKTGKPSINFTTSLTTRNKPSYNQFNILSSGDEMSIYQELYEKGWIDIANSNTARNHGVFSDMFYKITNNELAWGPGGTPNYNYLQRYSNANTDWFDVLFKDSFVYTNTFSISSGTDKARYRASVSSLKDEGQSIADNVENYTTNLNADFNLSDNFVLGFKLTGNVRDQRIAASQDREFDALSGVYERNFDINPFNFALYSSRSMTPYDENGDLQYYRRNWAPFNILHEVQNNFVDLDLIDLSLQTNLDWKINKDLTFNTVLQARRYRSSAVQTIHENSNNAAAYRADNPLLRNSNIFLFDDPDAPELEPYSVLPNGGFRKTTNNSLDNLFMRNSLNYSRTFNDLHQVDLLLGQEIRSSNRTEEFTDGWGYLFDKGGLIISDPNFIRFLDSRGEDYFRVEETRNRAWGAFTTAAYSYDSRYIINGTYTYFGDNRTGNSKAARYLPTWNLSGAWNIHQESFMDNARWVNLLKLKSTYGLSGSNPYDASAGLIVYGVEPLRPEATEREIALLIDQLENSELTFEKLYEWNIGLETAFFNNRLGIELEYYQRKSEDLIGFVETNGVGGEGIKLGNIGKLDRDGFEVSLRTTNIETSNFNWTSNFNFSHSKSEITEWDARDRIGDAISRNGGNFVGYAAGALFSIPFAGLDSNGIPTFYGEDGEIIQTLNLQEREDVLKHVKYEGPTEPVFFGGFNNTVSYKNLSLNFGFAYRGGNKIRLDDVYDVRLSDGSARLYDDFSSLSGDLINRWSLPGDENITNIPSILTETATQALRSQGLNPYDLYNKSDIRVADGDFVRLKNIRLSYNLPRSIIDKTKMKSGSISFSAHNLWLIYSDDKLNGVDPEFFQSGGVSLPLTSTYTFTLNFNF